MSTRFKHIFEKPTDKHFFSWFVRDGKPDPELIEFVQTRGDEMTNRWEPTPGLCAWLVERDKSNSVSVVGTDQCVIIQIADHDLAFEFKMKYC